MGRSKDISPLQGVRYGILDSLTRCLHLADFDRSYKKQRLFAHRISNCNVNVKVLWFAPSKHMYEHNFYGNVSFSESWSTLYGKFGPHLYYVDRQVSSTHTWTRVLLSRKGNHPLKKVSMESPNSPVYKLSTETLVATEYTRNGSQKTHILEVGIEVTNDDCRWLFGNCKVQVNNHNEANTVNFRGKFIKNVCHRHNTFGKHCPSDFDVQKATLFIENKYRDIEIYNNRIVFKKLQLVTRKTNEDDTKEIFDPEDYVDSYDDHEPSDEDSEVEDFQYSSWQVRQNPTHHSFGDVALRTEPPISRGGRSVSTRHDNSEDSGLETIVGVVAVGAAVAVGLAALFGSRRNND